MVNRFGYFMNAAISLTMKLQIVHDPESVNVSTKSFPTTVNTFVTGASEGIARATKLANSSVALVVF